MIPSASMGEYESGRRKSAPAKPPQPPGGGLFPLGEEGTYGRPPAAPAAPPPATPKRERKTKVYSSYSVDSKCGLHAKKLAKVEAQRERELEEQRSRRRRSMAASNGRGARNVSASPSRASSEARTSRSSKSPDPTQPPNGYNMRRKSSGASDVSARKSSTGYSSSSSNFQSSQRYSSSSSSYKISNIREENEDYTFQENRRKHSGYSKYADDGGLSNGMNGMSLDGLRKPNIDSWDSMGILGLSSKMWNDTSSKKQGYMSSMREESYNSYIM